MIKHKFSSILLLTLFVLSVPSFGQITCLSFTPELDRDDHRAGEVMTLTMRMNLEKGFHIYSVHPDMSLSPTAIEYADSMFFKEFGIINEPDTHMKFDENFGQVIGYHEGRFVLSQDLVISPEIDPGEYIIEGTLAYLACDATRCIPKWDDYSVDIDILPGAPRPEYMTAIVTEYPAAATDMSDSGSSGSINLDSEIEKGFLNFLILAFSMGLLVLLTPCVFPMIPITVSFFAQQGEKEGGRPVKSAAIYALGIIIIYTTIGMIVSILLGAGGANQIASNPWVNLVIALLFIVFTLSLFGWFELQVPSWIRQFSLKQEGRGGFVGILFMSLTFTVTAFTCTVQFMGLLLVAASRGDYLWPLLGMIAFSSAFALPFFFLALFPQYLSKLPKSGGWLNSVKVVMGFVIAGAAMKYLSNANMVWEWGIFSRQVVLSIWVVLAILLGFYLLGKIRLPHDSKLDMISVPRFIFAIIVLSFGLYLSTGLFGQRLSGGIETYLPHDLGTSSTQQASADHPESDLKWYENYADALDDAERTGKPIFLEFSGHTCTNCRWMETNVLSDDRVQMRFEDYILVKLYTDVGEGSKENQQMQTARFGTVSLPYYVVLSSEDEEILRFPGMDRDVMKFLAFLDKGLES